MEVEELVGWLHLPQSALPTQIVPHKSGCPAEGQESWPLSGPGAGQMAMRCWCVGPGIPFLEGTAEASSLSQLNRSSTTDVSCPSGAAGTACDSA